MRLDGYLQLCVVQDEKRKIVHLALCPSLGQEVTTRAMKIAQIHPDGFKKVLSKLCVNPFDSPTYVWIRWYSCNLQLTGKMFCCTELLRCKSNTIFMPSVKALNSWVHSIPKLLTRRALPVWVSFASQSGDHAGIICEPVQNLTTSRTITANMRYSNLENCDKFEMFWKEETQQKKPSNLNSEKRVKSAFYSSIWVRDCYSACWVETTHLFE